MAVVDRRADGALTGGSLNDAFPHVIATLPHTYTHNIWEGSKYRTRSHF